MCLYKLQQDPWHNYGVQFLKHFYEHYVSDKFSFLHKVFYFIDG